MSQKKWPSLDVFSPVLLVAWICAAALVIVAGILGLPLVGLIVPAMALGLVHESACRAILRTAALGAFVWLAVAVYQDLHAGGRISERVSAVFLGSLDRAAFGAPAYTLTGLIGGVIAGFSGWCGNSIRHLRDFVQIPGGK